ncbi:cupin domain-containing protein [Actinosynnema sp. CA-248983]
MTTLLNAAGEGVELVSPDATLTVKADLAQTGGFELFEVDVPRGPTVPPHATPWGVTFYILHGRTAVLVDGEVHDLGPGSTLTIPPGTMYTFTVHTPYVKLLAICPTDQMRRFFVDVDAALPPGTPLADAFGPLAEIADRHGVTLQDWPS